MKNALGEVPSAFLWSGVDGEGLSCGRHDEDGGGHAECFSGVHFLLAVPFAP